MSLIWVLRLIERSVVLKESKRIRRVVRKTLIFLIFLITLFFSVIKARLTLIWDLIHWSIHSFFFSFSVSVSSSVLINEVVQSLIKLTILILSFSDFYRVSSLLFHSISHLFSTFQFLWELLKCYLRLWHHCDHLKLNVQFLLSLSELN